MRRTNSTFFCDIPVSIPPRPWRGGCSGGPASDGPPVGSTVDGVIDTAPTACDGTLVYRRVWRYEAVATHRLLCGRVRAGGGLASSAVAATANHFPEGVSSPGLANACAVLLGTPAVANTGSATGFGNKVDLYVDACLGG